MPERLLDETAPFEGRVGATAPGIPPAFAARPALSDSATVGLAALVWAGARIATDVPVALGAGLVVVAFVVRRPGLLLVAGLLLGSAFGARAVDGLRAVRSAGYSGTVTLLSDPVDQLGSTTVDVRAGRHRFELRAGAVGRGTLSTRLAGERVRVVGRVRPPPPHSPWLAPRHIVGLLEVTTLEPADAGSPPWRAANVLRRALVRGAESMRPDRRSLYLGLILGDDRDQPATVTDDFRGSGLTHLLAVSGENVAFVLTLVGPLLRRCRLGPRWVVTLGVIGFFMVLTRFEPSVIRAGVMAGLAATAFLLGRPTPGVRLLALAVAGLVLVDPLLTRSVGFQLSVAASAGILLFSPVLARALPGPRALVEPLAVTAGAQLAVAPLLITTFGGLPVASIPCNLLAGPAAGLVMTWGIGAGIPAGLLGGPVAAALHVPTALGIRWIAAVARIGSTVPLGELRLGHVAVIAVALTLLAVARRAGWVALGRLAVLWVVLTMLAPAVALRSPPPGPVPVPGGQLWRAGGGTALVVGSARDVGDLLEGLRRAGVRRVDLLVLAGSPKAAAAVLIAVAHRWAPSAVWAGADAAVHGATAPPEGTAWRVGALAVTVTRVRPALAVSVTLGPSP